MVCGTRDFSLLVGIAKYSSSLFHEFQLKSVLKLKFLSSSFSVERSGVATSLSTVF